MGAIASILRLILGTLVSQMVEGAKKALKSKKKPQTTNDPKR